MNNVIEPVERYFLQAVTLLAYANPFRSARVAAERMALGPEFVEGEPVWSVSVADPEASRPNNWRIQEKLEPLLEEIRDRIAASPDISEEDFQLYEEAVHFLLYQRYYRSFVEAGNHWGFYRKLLADWQHLLVIPGKRLELQVTPDHFFACCWQVMRAFHRIFDHIIGSSLPAADLRASIWESIFTCDLRRYRRTLWQKMGDFPTLITGPSGTGKELVARAIAGARYLPFDSNKLAFEAAEKQAFFAINLAALSPGLIESELFGHKKGSFTGALTDRSGWLEACGRYGSVFLDELGEMELFIQVKLLRVLETREFSVVGDTKTQRFEGKLIAATNRDLADQIAEGRFREDLYYRLCADLIHTPSLEAQIRDKPEALRELVYYMTRRSSGDEADQAFPTVMQWIEKHMPRGYAWPGNYRELEQCVRNILIRQSYRPLTYTSPADPFYEGFRAGRWTAEDVLNHYAKIVYDATGSYVETARRLNIDRRTVKARVESASKVSS